METEVKSTYWIFGTLVLCVLTIGLFSKIAYNKGLNEAKASCKVCPLTSFHTSSQNGMDFVFLDYINDSDFHIFQHVESDFMLNYRYQSRDWVRRMELDFRNSEFKVVLTNMTCFNENWDDAMIRLREGSNCSLEFNGKITGSRKW